MQSQPTNQPTNQADQSHFFKADNRGIGQQSDTDTPDQHCSGFELKVFSPLKLLYSHIIHMHSSS